MTYVIFIMRTLFFAILLCVMNLKFLNGASLNTKPSNDNNSFVNITRHYDGDIIFIKDTKNCSENACLEVLGGSAKLFSDTKITNSPNCKCQCLNHLKTYREDDGHCVDTIRECSIIPFISSNTAMDTLEKIPSVFLPLQGQIIYPSKELFFPDENIDSKCVIINANYMTMHGWSDMKNTFHTNDIPFRLYNDNNRTFLQWSGDTTYRSLLQGRLVVLRLACWEGSNINLNSIEDPMKSIRNLSLCISFRVLGSLLKHSTNITEVQFAAESTNDKEPFSTNEYIIIAISSFCLGIMYIASVFLYIYLKKKKDRPNRTSSESNDKNFSRGVNIDLDSHGSNYHRNSSLSNSIDFIENPEANVIKSNPLIKHFLSFNENSAFVNDSSDAESSNMNKEDSNDNLEHFFDGQSDLHNGSNQECIPDGDISITEVNDMKNNYLQQNGTARRKLYFNPAYFEPELLAEPPQAAVEFLTKIREVITMAKSKMATKKFQPILNYISEEDSLSESRKNTISTHRSNKKDYCSGCPGCNNSTRNNKSANSCKNCGDKHKIIQKWLENVHNEADESSNDEKSDQNQLNDSSSNKMLYEVLKKDTSLNNEKSKDEDIKIVKGFVKEKNIFIRRDRNHAEETLENGSIPKIISHSLKKNIKEMIYSQNFVRDKVNVFEAKKAELVNNFSETHEIYNNPKFKMDNDAEIASGYDSSIKMNQDVIDQYSNPIKRANRKKNDANKMPDMIYEAIEMEKKNCKSLNYQSPTPDYSSEYEMTKFKNYDNVCFAPFVPTPDYYHTYSKNAYKNLKHYQPDSPIYSRKSPAYLIVDYETDSLERLNTIKNRPISTPTKSDFSSSQPSPSALPLEEEVEIRNALYDREEGFRKDTDTIKKEREIDIQMKKTKIMYNTPNEGSMTIELEGISPDENEDSSSNSDEFEPDTLDRHTKIKKNVESKMKSSNRVETKFVRNNENSMAVDEFGRILTLEVRHSKRQRNIGEASLKKLPNNNGNTEMHLIPPDVISSNKALFNKSAERKSLANNKTSALNQHEIKKAQISAPIQNLAMDLNDRKINKTIRGDFLKMDLLTLETNILRSELNSTDQSSLIKTIYHVDVSTPPQGFKESIKKTKDFKNAWKRFMGGLSSSKLKMYDISDEDEEKKIIKKSVNEVASEIKQGKVKDIVRKMSLKYMDNKKLREYDSGYLSAESLNNERILTDISLNANLNNRNNDKQGKALLTRPPLPPPPVPVKIKSSSSLNTQNYLSKEDLINISIYSSDDDDQNSSIHENDTHIDNTCEDIDADSDFSFVN